MISLKDYASQKKVSYEAVRKQVNRYKDELNGHIIIDGRQQFLDDEAVAFLDEKRKKNPVIVYEMNKDEEIAKLREEREVLSLKIGAMGQQIAELSQFKIEATEKRYTLEAMASSIAEREHEIEIKEREIEKRIAEAALEAAERARSEQEAKDKAEVDRISTESKEKLEAIQQLLQEEQDRQLTLWERLTGKKRKV